MTTLHKTLSSFLSVSGFNDLNLRCFFHVGQMYSRCTENFANSNSEIGFRRRKGQIPYGYLFFPLPALVFTNSPNNL